jgi:uncharacterized RDD family membrane protein YckC
MSEDAEGPVRKDDEAAPETSETATTAEALVPPEASPPQPESRERSEEMPAAIEPGAESEEAPAAAEPAAPPVAAPAPPPAVEAGPAAGSPSALAKADVGKRIVAAMIDFAIAFVMGLVPGVGQLLGAGYLVLRDGLELDFMNHRSIGKKVMKLHLESLEGQPLELITSVKRNWIFAIGPLVPLLFIIPILGWVMIPFALFAAIALGITELVLVITAADGRRLGDKWAGTMVVVD